MANLDVPVWSNDGKQVSYRGRPLRGADAETFEVLLGGYARDAASVYFRSNKAQTVDRGSFRALNANFGVDADRAYFAITPIKGADPKTFRVLDSSLLANPTGTFLAGGYVADASAVWFASAAGIKAVKKADPPSFVSLGNGFGVDRDRAYFNHDAIDGAKRATWRHWRGLLSVDDGSVYFASKKVVGVDRASITLLTANDCFADRQRLYCGAETISPESYLDRLKSVEQACARERDQVPSGRVLERICDGWAHEA